jgi:iron complex transport system substrate-binding protein
MDLALSRFMAGARVAGLARIMTRGMGAALALGLAASIGISISQAQAATAPSRVVTLLPSLTETVCALGACDRLVGVDRHSSHPPQIRDLPRLGGLEDPRIEALVALRPDLVIAPRSWRGTQRLERLGIAVLTIEPVSLAETRESLRLIAQALGLQTQRADQAWAAMEADWRLAATRIPPQWRGARVYLEVSSVPHAASARSFIGEVLERIGLKSAFGAEFGAFPRLSPEAVLKSDPQWIITSQEGFRTMGGRPGLKQLHALKAGRVCALSPAEFDLVVRPGPRLGEGALMIAACFRD